MKTYNLRHQPDADYTPSDVGPPEQVALNNPLTEQEREDYMEKLMEAGEDVIF